MGRRPSIYRALLIEPLKDKQGRVDAKLAKPVAAEDVARWFPQGLKIEARLSEAARAKEPGQ